MNLHDGQFADVSAVSGFDFPDDGRAAALVDWDQDGDQDLWLSNRTAPQVRLLLNQHPADYHYLALRLQGTRSNRDAIGSRVQVYCKDDPTRPQQRTIRAGDGYLAQSSKRLLFGLGKQTDVDRLVVRWPSGSVQTFQAPMVDQEYQVIEGRGQLIPISPRVTLAELHDKPAPSPKDDPIVGTLCFSMIGVPLQEYTDFDGGMQTLLAAESRLVLLNLWASWCAPCTAELREFTERQQELRRRGIDVVALSIDRVSSGRSTSQFEAQSEADRQLLEQIRFPFRGGRATRPMLEKLQLLHDTIFELKTPLPVPTSFLVDRKGRVVAVYKGAVSVDQLMADAEKLRARTTEQWRQATLPFAGHWVMPPRRRHLFALVRQLADRGYIDEARRYVEHNTEMFVNHPGWPELRKQLNPNNKDATTSH